MNFCYLISSHVKYSEPLKRLLKSMEYVPHTRKIAVVGGNVDCGSKPIMRNNCLIVGAEHNSFDYTALIAISQYKATHVFLLHDTMELTPESDALIASADPEMDATAAYDGCQCNLGLFRTDYLLKNRERILAMKNCTKAQAVAFEGALWKDAPKRAVYPNATVDVLSEATVYDGGLVRRTERYNSIMVLKHKASWGQDMACLDKYIKP